MYLGKFNEVLSFVKKKQDKLIRYAFEYIRYLFDIYSKLNMHSQ